MRVCVCIFTFLFFLFSFYDILFSFIWAFLFHVHMCVQCKRHTNILLKHIHQFVCIKWSMITELLLGNLNFRWWYWYSGFSQHTWISNEFNFENIRFACRQRRKRKRRRSRKKQTFCICCVWSFLNQQLIAPLKPTLSFIMYNILCYECMFSVMDGEKKRKSFERSKHAWKKRHRQ